MPDLPIELRYTTEHTWIGSEDDDAYLLGLSEAFVALYGEPEDLEFIGSEGESFEEGDPLVRINSDEEEVEISAPVNGRVIDFHVDLVDSPELITDSPYRLGWLVRFELEDEEELEELLTADEYEGYMRDEAEGFSDDDDLEDDGPLGLGRELDIEPDEDDELDEDDEEEDDLY